MLASEHLLPEELFNFPSVAYTDCVRLLDGPCTPLVGSKSHTGVRSDVNRTNATKLQYGVFKGAHSRVA
jgi:hypothetical protein